MKSRSKPTPATVLSARLGGGAAAPQPHDGSSLADLLPYAPRVDRADFVFDDRGWCPQLRVNYP